MSGWPWGSRIGRSETGGDVLHLNSRVRGPVGLYLEPSIIDSRESTALRRVNRGPRVFVSYAHDSAEHKEDVLGFCEFLVEVGIDVHLDQWYLDERRDWQRWAVAQIQHADFVIVIASPVCRLVGNGNIGFNVHRGLQSELRLLYELYHRDPETWIRRILPVVFPGRSIDDIPLFLQPRTADHYRITDFSVGGADELLRILTRQPSYQRPPRGSLPILPPRRRVRVSDTHGYSHRTRRPWATGHRPGSNEAWVAQCSYCEQRAAHASPLPERTIFEA
jgi:SEFIR domain